MHVLVIAPHPDDEAIGCGGVITKHVADGDTVRILYLTDGEKGIPGTPYHETVIIRHKESDKVREIPDVKLCTWESFPDGELAFVEDEVKAAILQQMYGADIVYCPHTDEKHADHATVAHIVYELSKKNEALDLEVRYYECWTPLADPNLIVDITPYINHKRQAIREYQSQDSRNSFSEAIIALNHYRGLLHGPNKYFAEAFYVE